MTRAVAAFALLLLAGCSGQPPLLSLAGRTCDAAPRLQPGNDLPLRRGSGKSVVLDAKSPCLQTPAGLATYAVFALPPSTTPYQVTVTSEPAGRSLVSPTASIYAADDHPRVDMGAFRAAKGALVASVRGQPGDRYLVVTSTPGTIGNPLDVTTAANPTPIRIAAAVFVPIIIPAAPVGPITDKLATILAHSGYITASATPYETLP